MKFAPFFSRKGKSSVSDPDSIRPVNPYPDSESGSRRSKMTHRSWKKIQKFHLTCMLSSRAPSPSPTQRFNGFFRCARYANKLQREQFLMKSAFVFHEGKNQCFGFGINQVSESVSGTLFRNKVQFLANRNI